TLPGLWVAASRMTLSPARMAGGANTGAPSPNCTLPGLWVAASRMTLSPARMAGGATTGDPSPSCTLPRAWATAPRPTLVPTPGRRAFTISYMECLLFMEVPLPSTLQPKSIGTAHLLDSGLGPTGTRYWHWPGRVLGPRLRNVIAGYLWLSFRAQARQNIEPQ